MYLISISLVGRRYPNHFRIIVDEDTYYLFARYIREYYPDVGCNDTNMPPVLKEVINSSINTYLEDHPYYKETEARFSDIESLHQISILNDSIVSKTVKNGIFVIENHEGVVSYCDRSFAIRYRTSYDLYDKVYIPCSAITYDVYLLPEKKYHGQSTSLASACQNAIDIERRAKEYELYKADFKVWEDYYRANKDAFNNWFSPLLESRNACKKCRTSIKCSVLSKHQILSLEKGTCPFCASFCKLATISLKEGEHSEQWYKLKLDEYQCPDMP